VKTVCQILFKIYTHFILKKVRNCSAEDKSSSTAGHTAPSKPTSRPKLAANILKLNRQTISESGQPTISLEMEVDQYLSDPNQGTGILEFWQVVLIFMNCTKPIYLLTFITGTSTSISPNFSSCYGYYTYPSLKCTL
jgi:hypothetical protein